MLQESFGSRSQGTFGGLAKCIGKLTSDGLNNIQQGTTRSVSRIHDLHDKIKDGILFGCRTINAIRLLFVQAPWCLLLHFDFFTVPPPTSTSLPTALWIRVCCDCLGILKSFQIIRGWKKIVVGTIRFFVDRAVHHHKCFQTVKECNVDFGINKCLG